MTSTAQLRRATLADIPALLGLVEQYWGFEKLPGFDAARIATQLERLLTEERLGCGWLARVGGEPAGYLLAVYVFSLEHFGLTAEIDELFVLPRHRTHGVGSMLLDAAEKAFAQAGCANVSLQLSRANTAGRAFYRSRGYAERAAFELLDKMPRKG
jgi:GNAT superfamily N-acetyltransferase